MVYLSRQALHEVSAERSQGENSALQQHVAALNELASGWNNLLRQQGNSGCQTVIDAANHYISALDGAINQQAQGAKMTEENMIKPFNALVYALDINRSC